MKPQNTILDEIKAIAPVVAEVGIHLPYQVPNGYFAQLSDSIVEKLNKESLPIVQGKIYDLPDQYFSGLADKILHRVKEMDVLDEDLYTENERIAPILNTLSKGMPYTVPEQYFALRLIPIPKEAKIVPMRVMRTWMTYAAAAVFLGIMVTGSFLFSDKKQAQDFEKYQNMDVASALDQVSDTELNNYIDQNHAISVDEVSENEPVILDNVNDKIQSLSTENLNQYLNENGFLELKPE